MNSVAVEDSDDPKNVKPSPVEVSSIKQTAIAGISYATNDVDNKSSISVSSDQTVYKRTVSQLTDQRNSTKRQSSRGVSFLHSPSCQSPPSYHDVTIQAPPTYRDLFPNLFRTFSRRSNDGHVTIQLRSQSSRRESDYDDETSRDYSCKIITMILLFCIAVLLVMAYQYGWV